MLQHIWWVGRERERSNVSIILFAKRIRKKKTMQWNYHSEQVKLHIYHVSCQWWGLCSEVRIYNDSTRLVCGRDRSVGQEWDCIDGGIPSMEVPVAAAEAITWSVDRVSAIDGFGIHVNRGHGAAHIMCAALHSKYIMTLMQSMGSSSLCMCLFHLQTTCAQVHHDTTHKVQRGKR